MAKHRRTRAAKSANKQAAKCIHPSGTYTNPERPQPASLSTTQPNAKPQSVPPLTLGDRFHRLLPELRAEIFACLLVRCVKWDVKHRTSLSNRPCQADEFGGSTSLMCKGTCAEDFHHPPKWRTNTKPIHTAPWRSTWAPERLNPYICSECYERRFRPQPSPRMHSLPCLCARRRHLQVLLVCRQWYEEAGHVLYTRNTWAFAHPSELVGFVSTLTPRWKLVVSKVSLMITTGTGYEPESASEELEMAKEHVQCKLLRSAWTQLQQLPALSHLELDAILLTRPESARVLRTVPLKNLRSVVFMQGCPDWPSPDWKRTEIYVWPRIAWRRNIKDHEADFAVEVARTIRGLRYGWMKNSTLAVQSAMAKEESKYLGRFKLVPVN